jgi:methylphosphotriester-DNA--protein-cysteine methyltransferase
VLAPWVECYWSYSTSLADRPPIRVLPDGCADIIIEIRASPDPFVIGAMRRAIITPPGAPDLFGIRFRPARALAFVGTPLTDFTDARTALDAVWVGSRRALTRELAESLADAPHACRPAIADRVLEQCLMHRVSGEDLAAHAVTLIRQHRGRITVRGLASALGSGERRLERTCATHVGLTPKELARVVRFGTVVRCVQEGSRWRWTQLAWDAGYADQAHLAREFRALAGIPPTAYVAERRGVGFLQDALDKHA